MVHLDPIEPPDHQWFIAAILSDWPQIQQARATSSVLPQGPRGVSVGRVRPKGVVAVVVGVSARGSREDWTGWCWTSAAKSEFMDDVQTHIWVRKSTWRLSFSDLPAHSQKQFKTNLITTSNITSSCTGKNEYGFMKRNNDNPVCKNYANVSIAFCQCESHRRHIELRLFYYNFYLNLQWYWN